VLFNKSQLPKIKMANVRSGNYSKTSEENTEDEVGHEEEN
jgi:hypothetical protein